MTTEYLLDEITKLIHQYAQDHDLIDSAVSVYNYETKEVSMTIDISKEAVGVGHERDL